MRIAQIVPSLEERHGGPSKSVRGWPGGLARLPQSVSLLATAHGAGSRQIDGNLEIEICPRDWPDRLCRSRRLKARLDELQPEIVHHHSVWLRTLHYAHRRARRLGVPLVISPRGMLNPWTWAHRPWRKRLARAVIHPGALAAARGWHATSESEADGIRRLGFTQPICVAPNGVDIPSSEQIAAAAQHWHKLEPATAQQPVALFYSRFHRKKRLLELIDLWLERGPRDWLLLIAGIPQEYSVAGLSEYVLNASGTGRVRIAAGVGHPPPYAVASLFLLPSHDENFGLAIAEALAHGVPALVTDTTPWSALNEHGGWCVPWAAFGTALDAAVAEGAERLRVRGRQSRAWVESEFSWEKPARTLADFYGRLARG